MKTNLQQWCEFRYYADQVYLALDESGFTVNPSATIGNIYQAFIAGVASGALVERLLHQEQALQELVLTSEQLDLYK